MRSLSREVSHEQKALLKLSADKNIFVTDSILYTTFVLLLAEKFTGVQADIYIYPSLNVYLCSNKSLKVLCRSIKTGESSQAKYYLRPSQCFLITKSHSGSEIRQGQHACAGQLALLSSLNLELLLPHPLIIRPAPPFLPLLGLVVKVSSFRVENLCLIPAFGVDLFSGPAIPVT